MALAYLRKFLSMCLLILFSSHPIRCSAARQLAVYINAAL